MVKSSKRRKRNKDNESDSLSDIDDAEVHFVLFDAFAFSWFRIVPKRIILLSSC